MLVINVTILVDDFDMFDPQDLDLLPDDGYFCLQLSDIDLGFFGKTVLTVL